MKLSKFSEIIVGARVSKTAGATPQSGDLQGFAPKMRIGSAPVTIVIDQAIP
jgi:cytochrome c-type biogenesis protein CcmH